MSSPADSYDWNPKAYGEHARFVSELGLPVMELLAPRPGERILDLGCGDGALTRRLAESGARVTGVDASAAMVDAARALGLDARVADAMDLPFRNEFDAVFSNAALHWMPRPDAVLVGVRRALVPGGRFVGEFGGAGNVAAIVAALDAALAELGKQVLCPWFFPTAEVYGELLAANGFGTESIELFRRPTPLPGDIRDWLVNFAQHYTAVIAEPARAGFIERVREILQPTLSDGAGNWHVDYVRLRFRAAASS